MKYILKKIREVEWYFHKIFSNFKIYFKYMTINQEDITDYISKDISKFIKMNYGKSLFIINEVKAVILPNRKNYQSIPYKFFIVFQYQGKKFKITIEYHLKEENVKYGLLFNEDVDYGEVSLSIAEFYSHIITSQKLIKSILQSAELPS
ncbi:hypothetical protein [Flavobacterium sp. WG21]|uniref:hypothetical protein n=1 Tax=Flavobacterium sp. WG21 TaxID=1229487 RepID=UPI00036B2B4C|nr:hypothetical protein [Flavobacterium sp. WG21]